MKQSKQIIKRIVDLAMIVLLPLLMAEILIGQEIHEWLGTGMLVLFAVHHILNAGWWKSLFKGKYTPSRALSVTIDLLLLLDMAGAGDQRNPDVRFIFDFAFPAQRDDGCKTASPSCLLLGIVLMSAHVGMHMVCLWVQEKTVRISGKMQ